MNADSMWRVSGFRGTYETVSFGEGIQADKLAQLVLCGKKTATCSALYWYETGVESMPEPGEYSVVLDSHDQAVCIIQTTRVYITAFHMVTADHAAKEGEGDLSLSYWRQEHSRFFRKDLAEAGQTFDENTMIVCEDFQEAYPPVSNGQ